MMVIIVVSIKRLTWVDVTIMVDNSEKRYEIVIVDIYLVIMDDGDNSCVDKKVGKGRCREGIRGSVYHSFSTC